MTAPRVTILTATYNQERYVARCIESVLGQTFADWEMVVVDDGSSDRTAAVAASFVDPRIKVISLPHRGIESLHESYSVALAASSAPLVAILDGDDYWLPHKLARQVPVFDDPDVVITFGEIDLVDRNDVPLRRSTLPEYASGKHDGKTLIVPMLYYRFYPYSTTVVLRRGVLEDSGGFVQPEGMPLTDAPTWLNVLTRGAAVGLPDVMAAYRVHASSVCRTRADDITEGWLRYSEAWLEEHWRLLPLPAGECRRMRRDFIASVDHRRAVLLAKRGDWPGARALFRSAFAKGNPERKLRTAARYLVTVLARAGKGGPMPGRKD